MSLQLAFDFETYQKERRLLIEQRLTQYLSPSDPERLWDSMRYSVLSGGKRIRAVLCLSAAEACGIFYKDKQNNQNDEPISAAQAAELALPLACAIEMVHAMSLMHDDLPCMDDDDFRRGKPSNHKVFGEALALLAGDNLLVLANELLLRESANTIAAENLLKVAAGLAAATGAAGMVGGQVLDMELTGADFSQLEKEQIGKQLSKIHERKTAALLSFSVWSGACLLGAPEPVVKNLAEFGKILGISFQIADDLLDETGNIKTLGKTPGKDKMSGKLTWLTAYGMEASRHMLSDLETRAKSLLEQTGLSSQSLEPLSALLKYAIHRNH